MLHLITFEAFSEYDDQKFPKYNPANKKMAEEYVEELRKSDINKLYELGEMKFPKGVNKEEADRIEELVIKKAIQKLLDDPNLIKDNRFKFTKPYGDPVPRVQRD